MKLKLCNNCHKPIIGECPICKGQLICKIDGCTNKTWREWICKNHYEERKNEKINTQTGD